MTKRKPLAVVKRMHKHFDNGEHWVKGTFVERYNNITMGFCLVGALGYFLLGTEDVDEAHLQDDPTTMLLVSIISEQYPERVVGEDPTMPTDVIMEFNDHDQTTWQDVDRVLDKLRVRLEEM